MTGRLKNKYELSRFNYPPAENVRRSSLVAIIHDFVILSL